MYNVSTAFHAAFADYGREIKAKVIFNGQTELDGNYVQEITATPAFDSSDGISVGSACSGRCKIRIYKPDEPLQLSGGYFVPYIASTFLVVIQARQPSPVKLWPVRQSPA